MTDEIKSMVLKALKIYGVKRVRKVYLKSLDDSIKLKNKMLSQGSPLYNIPNHIELNNEKLPESLHTAANCGDGLVFHDSFQYKRQWTDKLEQWLKK